MSSSSSSASIPRRAGVEFGRLFLRRQLHEQLERQRLRAGRRFLRFLAFQPSHATGIALEASFDDGSAGSIGEGLRMHDDNMLIS